MNKIKTFLLKGTLTMLLLSVVGIVTSQQTVVFNTSNLNNGEIEAGIGCINSCWLLDSDIKRPRNISNEDRWAEIGLGSVRYPYGHLADNYLWDTPPYGSFPLVPEVGSKSVTPGSWSWAVNSDKTMKDCMDFDEFMAICQRQHIKPLVVVNTMSYKYTNGPTYATLKTTAVEWVKYAKSKGYEVAYWQIGNEVDHHQDIFSKTEYISLYKDFVTAMKAEDSTIVCGTGILYQTAYFTDLMLQAASLVDFASVHQYLFSKPFTNYSTWLNHNGSDLNTNVKGMQNAVNNSSKKNTPILVTESNAFGCFGDSPSLFKGMAWFDMLLSQQMYEDVQYTYMWNSHSPWHGENGVGSLANALTNDNNNSITTMGMPLKIINITAEERLMIPDNKVHGKTYSYGTYTPGTGDMTIYLLNKATSSAAMTVNINNYNMPSSYARWVWTGSSEEATTTTFTKTGNISITDSSFTTNLPPHSIVVVQLGDDIPEPEYPIVNFTEPANNQNFNEGDDVGVVVSATDNERVSNVELYLDGILVRQDTLAPYQWTADTALLNMEAGTYTLRAIATDNDGQTGEDGITITVETPLCDTAITPYLQINGGAWQEAASASLDVGDGIKFGPQPINGAWSWSGPNGFSASTREITISNIQANKEGNYVASYTNACGATSNQTFAISVNGNRDVSVTDINVTPSSATLTAAGATEELTVTIIPDSATNKTVDWSSSNAGVATVSPSGLLTAVANGNATITATSEDGEFTDECVVTISINQTSIAIDRTASQSSTETLIYPNPANEVLNISGNENYSCKLYDIQGRIVLSDSNLSGNNKIYLENLNEGIYILQISNSKYSEIMKIIVE